MAELTKEQVAEARANAVETEKEKPCLTGRFIIFLCDSHEALRLRAEEAERNANDYARQMETMAQEVVERTAERDARAEVVSRLRDQLEQARQPTAQHIAWERHMDGTPRGTRAMPVYLTGDGDVIVCGPPNPKEGAHDCDAMGCSSVSHVAWRGHVDDLWPLLWGTESDAAKSALVCVRGILASVLSSLRPYLGGEGEHADWYIGKIASEKMAEAKDAIRSLSAPETDEGEVDHIAHALHATQTLMPVRCLGCEWSELLDCERDEYRKVARAVLAARKVT